MRSNKTIIITIIAFFFLALALIVALTSTPEYYINQGIDFATGKRVVGKYIGEKTGKPVWVKYSSNPNYEAIMKKYHLGYKEPILSYYCGTSYRFSWFSFNSVHRGMRFWKWRYYILKPRSYMCWDGISVYSTFYQIVGKFSPPPNDVKEMYDECIRIYESKTDVFKQTQKYLQERYEHYYSPRLKGIIERLFKTGDEKLYMNSEPEQIAKYLYKNRNDFPDQLPDNFLRLAVKQDLFIRVCAGPWKNNSFLLKEFISHPTKKNALYLALSRIKDYMSGYHRLDSEFRELDKVGRLKQFVKMVMPDKPVRALPAPRTPSKHGRALNIYYKDTYKGLPERNAALQMTFNTKLLRAYWENELKKLLMCQIL